MSLGIYRGDLDLDSLSETEVKAFPSCLKVHPLFVWVEVVSRQFRIGEEPFDKIVLKLQDDGVLGENRDPSDRLFS